MPVWWIYPVVGGFFLSVVLTDLIRLAARKFSIVDAPDGAKKQHKESTPLLGGVAIYGSFSFVVILILLFSDHFTSGAITDRHFIGFLLGGFVLILGGVLDDKFNLPAKWSILFPVTAAFLAVYFGIGVEKITNPAGGAFEITQSLSDVFTFLWLMGMMYTTKLLDGMDGLSTGISTIAAGMIALLALSAAYFQPDVALLSLIAVAVLLGFLLWNTNPAKIFLGEGGSTFVGFLVGVLAVISGGKLATALLVLGIPVLDVLFVMFGRWKSGKAIFTRGDRSHLHHRLLSVGLSHKQVVALYYTVAMLFGFTTLIFESWQKLIALFVLFCLSLLALHVLSKKALVIKPAKGWSAFGGKNSLFKYILFGALALFAASITVFAFRNSDTVMITVGNSDLEVLIAESTIEQIRGLSGTALETYPAEGMLFVYSDEKPRTFWMHAMNYDLDVLWIANGVVLKIDEGVKAPGRGEEPDRMHSAPYPVDQVLELPSGMVNDLGLKVGDLVTNS